VNINRGKWILKFAVIAVLAVAAVGWAVMGLWNWLGPELFGWHPIGFVQALGLLILCRILVGGFRGGFGAHRRARFEERLAQMSPEERDRFRAGMRARCGGHSPARQESDRDAGEPAGTEPA
jgi:hypothetical protein